MSDGSAAQPLKAPWFVGGGEMGALMRAKDWSQTLLGPPETWSAALRTTTSLLLANRFPMLLWWGPDSVSIYNDAYIPVLGVKHPAALGQPVRECWSEIYDVLRPLIQTPLTGGAPTWSEDLRLEIRRHGFLEETHWTVAYSPVPDDTAPNGIGGVLATVHEITAQVVGERRNALLRELGARSGEAKTADEACATAAATFHRYPHDVPFVLIYLIDRDGSTARLAASEGVERGSPESPESIALGGDSDDRGWPVAEVARSGKARLVDDLDQRFTHVPKGFWEEPPRQALVLPIESRMPNQTAGVLVVGLSPRLDLDASHHGFFDLATAQLATAIANARAYEEEHQRAQALAKLDRAKTVFFSNVSHEFRTPLTLMLGPLEEELGEGLLTDEQRQRLDTVHRNALRLRTLVNALLDFSSIEAGRIQASYEPTDLATFTAELASSFRSLLESAGLKLVLNCSPLAEPVFVDRRMWEKIVLNLISNAFKFTLAGEVTVSVEADEQSARLKVQDTGIGIASKDVQNLFERFYRVEGAHGRTHEGTGIGLALVRELARLHGGSASVESESGQGATFTITVPFGKDHLPQDRIRGADVTSTLIPAGSFVDETLGWLGKSAREPLAEVLVEVPPAEAATARLLVVDDNADMRLYLQRLLRPLGTVELATDGKEALAAIARQRPDLVLSDDMMPNLDGRGLVRALRADPRTRTLPVMLVSARAGDESRIEGADVGADDYVIKPFSARELVARARAQLQLSRQRDEYSRALRDSEERFRALVTASSEVVYRMSPDWHELRSLVGRDFIADETGPSQTWLEKYIHPEDQPRVKAVVQESIRTRSLFQLEHRVLRVDGSYGWTFSRAIPVLDAHGEILEWFGVAADITARKNAEEALIEADRHKSEFLAMLSHELRNPLAPIRNALHILSRVPPESPRARQAQTIIDRQFTHLTRIVDDLLDVTRISSGKIRLHCGRLDVNELARQIVEDHRSLFEKSRVGLEFRGTAAPVWVDGDRTRLAQCLANLLQNAAKFTPARGKAEVVLQTGGSQLSLVVRDNGYGIAPELLPRLFTPFAQAETTLDRSRGGLGLGLSLVKGLVELHGGTVTVTSGGLGTGSTFEIRMPLAVDTQPSEVTPRPRPPAAPRRVLIIEDNIDAADSLGLLMELKGHVVEIAHSATEGLTKARSFVPEAVICDIGLPGMDGFEVARRMRADEHLRATKLVALSGYATQEDVDASKAAGFDAHMAKPLDAKSLDGIFTV